MQLDDPLEVWYVPGIQEIHTALGLSKINCQCTPADSADQRKFIVDPAVTLRPLGEVDP